MSTEPTFDSVVIAAIKGSILKKLQGGDWLTIEYAERPKLPSRLLHRLMARVDMEEVMELATKKVEARIADRLYNSLATELSNDTKAIMSDQELRQQFRSILAQKLRNRGYDVKDGGA
ncbi:MAG: hypothetical protein ACPG4T_03345 [Nannocystaceae bacterium]